MCYSYCEKDFFCLKPSKGEVVTFVGTLESLYFKSYVYNI